MSVFMENVCKYRGCGTTFETLGELIHHIEFTHIDNDPEIISRKQSSAPHSMPMSCVLRYFADQPPEYAQILQKPCRTVLPSISSVNISTGASDCQTSSSSEDSNDSWTHTEDVSSDCLPKDGPKTPVEKPFICPVPGCKKRYKNVNGMKYHSKNGHKPNKFAKHYRCPCGKGYKTNSGLRAHIIANHTPHSAPNVSNLDGYFPSNNNVAQAPSTYYPNYYNMTPSTRFIRAALEGVAPTEPAVPLVIPNMHVGLPPFNVLQSNQLAPEYSNSFVDPPATLGVLTPSPSPRPLSAFDKVPPHAFPQNPGLLSQTPYNPNYFAMNNNFERTF